MFSAGMKGSFFKNANDENILLGRNILVSWLQERTSIWGYCTCIRNYFVLYQGWLWHGGVSWGGKLMQFYGGEILEGGTKMERASINWRFFAGGVWHKFLTLRVQVWMKKFNLSLDHSRTYFFAIAVILFHFQLSSISYKNTLVMLVPYHFLSWWLIVSSEIKYLNYATE